MFGTTRVYAAICAAMIVALSGCGGSPVSPTNGSGTTVPTKQVIVLGDSLSVSPTKDQSFPAVLQGRIQDIGLRWTIV